MLNRSNEGRHPYLVASFREKVFSAFVLISVAGCSVILFILLKILFVVFSFSMLFSCFPWHQFFLWYQYTGIILLPHFNDLEGIYTIPLDSSRDVFLLALVMLQTNHFQLHIKWTLLCCTFKRISKSGNFLYTCLGPSRSCWNSGLCSENPSTVESCGTLGLEKGKTTWHVLWFEQCYLSWSTFTGV